MRTIDSDAHVIENPHTWDFMEEADRKYAPIVVTQTSGLAKTSNEGGVHKEHWLVGGNNVLPKDKLVDTTTPEAAREMTDVDARLRHMDELQIDVQVLYPTMFLRPLTADDRVGTALARGYNRWLAQIWKKGQGRLRWAAIPPLLDMSKVRDELAWAKDHGACCVFLNGYECERELSDRYFFPLYKAAGELDLALCMHAGINSFTVHNFFINDSFAKFKVPIISAFHCLVMQGIPDRFPSARWGFIEASAQWIPYVLKELGHRLKRSGKRLPANPLKDYRMYVTCEVNDDLAMILPYSGEDHLVIGTDYGHNDTSTEIEALRRLKTDGKVPAHVVDKILGDNARALYGFN